MKRCNQKHGVSSLNSSVTVKNLRFTTTWHVFVTLWFYSAPAFERGEGGNKEKMNYYLKWVVEHDKKYESAIGLFKKKKKCCSQKSR